MKKSSFLSGLVVTLGVIFSGPVSAEYPEKPITLICWSSAGSGHDLMARMIAKVGEEYLGQPIVVVNKEGGSGQVAMSYVLNQRADGYVLMTNTRSMTELFPDPKGRLSIDDFKYVSRMVRDPFVLLVGEDSPFMTIEDLVAYAQANPGKITMGGFSIKSVDESLVRDFEAAAGIQFNYIPYRGGSEPVVAVLGGHIDAAVANPSEMIANYGVGKLRVLALATQERFSPFDDIPTFSEKGYEVVTEHWRGVMASKEVPDEIINRLDAALARIVDHPEFKQFMSNANMYNGYMSSDAFARLVKSQTNQ
jgi:tripartite-type tricarboxylate transporter receptor subunit TctC